MKYKNEGGKLFLYSQNFGFIYLFIFFIEQVNTAPPTMAGRVEWHGTAHLDGRCQP